MSMCLHGARSLPRGVLVLVACVLCHPAVSTAGERHWRQQPPGLHSTICTFDGQIRDDHLALHVANQIAAHGGQARDVVIITNTCYGGGLLGDFAFVFSPAGPCPGVPWVFGSASEWYEQAWAFRAEWCADPIANLGSKFTSALAGPHSGRWNPTPGAMRDAASNNVPADLQAASQCDEAGPHHERWENPVIAWGNGGEAATWNPSGASHEVILFGGLMDQPAYTNDMENLHAALLSLYGAAPAHVQLIPDGTTQDLLNGISAACASLTANTKLLLHFTDHGGFVCDVVERLQSQGQQPPYVVPQFKDIVIWHPPLPWPPWPFPPPPPPPPEDDGPRLSLRLLFPIWGAHWVVCLNDDPLPLPPGPLAGEIDVPVAWESFRDGENHLTISAVGMPGEPFVFDRMELSSGPVAMRTDPPPLAAVGTVLGYWFTAPWFPGSAVPFQVPTQVDRPAWSLIGPLAYRYSDDRWPGRRGFWGITGPGQSASLVGRLFNSDSRAERQRVTIRALIKCNDPAVDRWSAVVRPRDGDNVVPSPAHRPRLMQVTPASDGAIACVWEHELTPVGQHEDVIITLKTGSSGDAYIFIDDLTITALGQPKDGAAGDECVPPEHRDRSQSHYYYFDAPQWPPEPHYGVLPSWHLGVTWERLGAFPPERLGVVSGCHGVLGLPGGAPGDGHLLAWVDGQARPTGREHVACEFEYFVDGGWLMWHPVVPPETAVENLREVVEELDSGWRRVRVTFDLVPPPAWQGFHWLFGTTQESGPVAIDNLAISSSDWWADYWHDAFDFHAVGEGLHGRYGWKGRDNDPLADGTVTDYAARSAFHALKVAGPTDLVQEFDLALGRYLLTAWQYVPGDFQSGCDPPGLECGSQLIVLNTYEDGGPYHRSIQLRADSLTGTLIRQQPTLAALPLVTDRWARIDILIDLPADSCRVFYDGAELGSAASWTAGVSGGGGGALRVAALELVANNSTVVQFDDLYMRLSPAGDLDGDGWVSVDDLIALAACLAGPGVSELPPGVTAQQFALADLDGDLDVDAADFARFQTAIRCSK